jgi:hypothetical protein
MIVVESVLQNLFATLPPIEVIGADNSVKLFEPTFDFGNKEDLAILLKQEIKIYPLIWLESGFTETHNTRRDEVSVELSFKIATYGLNSTLLNQQRLKGTMEQVLFPVLENVRKALERSNVVLLKGEDWEITKYYNYGGDNIQETPHVWDAIRFDVSLTLNNNCLKPFSYG